MSGFYTTTSDPQKHNNKSIRPRWCCGKPGTCGFLRSNTVSLAKCIRARNHAAGGVFAEFVGRCRLSEGAK